MNPNPYEHSTLPADRELSEEPLEPATGQGIIMALAVIGVLPLMTYLFLLFASS